MVNNFNEIKGNAIKKIVIHVKALKDLLFVPNKLLNIFLVRSFYYRQLIWQKKEILISLSHGKYCLIHLENWKDT